MHDRLGFNQKEKSGAKKFAIINFCMALLVVIIRKHKKASENYFLKPCLTVNLEDYY
ncbi:hypothetical protein NC999_19390 [Leptolyngbya sp. GB2-A1]